MTRLPQWVHPLHAPLSRPANERKRLDVISASYDQDGLYPSAHRRRLTLRHLTITDDERRYQVQATFAFARTAPSLERLLRRNAKGYYELIGELYDYALSTLRLWGEQLDAYLLAPPLRHQAVPTPRYGWPHSSRSIWDAVEFVRSRPFALTATATVPKPENYSLPYLGGFLANPTFEARVLDVVTIGSHNGRPPTYLAVDGGPWKNVSTQK